MKKMCRAICCLGAVAMLAGCKDKEVVYKDVSIVETTADAGNVALNVGTTNPDATASVMYTVLEDHGSELGRRLDNIAVNMDITDYLGEVILSLSDPEWEDFITRNMLDQKIEGYQYTVGTNDILYINAGEDLSGEFYTTLQLKRIDGSVRMIRQTKDSVILFQSEGLGVGAFEAWILDGTTGNMFEEIGKMSDNVITGNISVHAHKGAGQTSIYTMWCNRDSMDYDVIEKMISKDLTFFGLQPERASLAKMCEEHSNLFLGSKSGASVTPNTSKDSLTTEKTTEIGNDSNSTTSEISDYQETKPDDLPYDTDTNDSEEEWSPDIM